MWSCCAPTATTPSSAITTLAAVGKLSLERFNPYAAAANRWTAARLTREQADYIGGLPLTLELDEFTLAHGSPRNPIWEYLVTVDAAIACFTHIDTYWCLVGHSHTPFMCIPQGTTGAAFLAFPPDRLVQLDSRPLIVNPRLSGTAARRRCESELCNLRRLGGDDCPSSRRLRHSGDAREDAPPRTARLPNRAACPGGCSAQRAPSPPTRNRRSRHPPAMSRRQTQG